MSATCRHLRLPRSSWKRSLTGLASRSNHHWWYTERCSVAAHTRLSNATRQSHRSFSNTIRPLSDTENVISSSSTYPVAEPDKVLNDTAQHSAETTGGGVLNKYTARAQGRSCLVTGATSGIGYAVLSRLLAEGASHIRIITRDRERGYKAVDRARQEVGRSDGDVLVLEQDFDEAKFSSRRFFAAGEDRPAIDTFIHCAGISQSSLAISTPAAVRSRILRVNAEVYMDLLADFLKQYHSSASKSRDAANAKNVSFCAVGVSSLLAVTGGYGSSSYAASKAAMLAYNRALSLEAGHIAKKHEGRAPRFRVNTIVPGYIDTPMVSGFSAEARSDLESDIPLGRFGTPEEVADAVLFLIANEYANNCVLNLDGGLSAT